MKWTAALFFALCAVGAAGALYRINTHLARLEELTEYATYLHDPTYCHTDGCRYVQKLDQLGQAPDWQPWRTPPPTYLILKTKQP